MQVIFSYGDLGLTYSRSMIFLGCMLGMLAAFPALENQADAEENRLPEIKRATNQSTSHRRPAPGEARMSIAAPGPGQHGDHAGRATDHLERNPCDHGRARCSAGC